MKFKQFYLNTLEEIVILTAAHNDGTTTGVSVWSKDTLTCD